MQYLNIPKHWDTPLWKPTILAAVQDIHAVVRRSQHQVNRALDLFSNKRPTRGVKSTTHSTCHIASHRIASHQTLSKLTTDQFHPQRATHSVPTNTHPTRTHLYHEISLHPRRKAGTSDFHSNSSSQPPLSLSVFLYLQPQKSHRCHHHSLLFDAGAASQRDSVSLVFVLFPGREKRWTGWQARTHAHV